MGSMLKEQNTLPTALPISVHVFVKNSVVFERIKYEESQFITAKARHFENSGKYPGYLSKLKINIKFVAPIL